MSRKGWMIRGGIVTAVAAGTLFIACAGKGPPRPTCADVGDAGAIDAPYIDVYTHVTTDAQPPEAYGMESDPGPVCTDCQQDDVYEIMTISDFEDGFAPAWFNYGEPGVLIEPPQAGLAIDADGGTVDNQNPPQPWWGLQVADLSKANGGARCGSKYALHLEGARFPSWGGGYVTRHFIVRGEYMNRENLCGVRKEGEVDDAGNPLPPNRRIDGDLLVNGIGEVPMYMPGDNVNATAETATGCMFWVSPIAEQPSLLGIDVSDFDGVSFWARRGPSGQAALRVALIDDNVSPELALYKERKYWLEQKLRDPEAVVDPDKAGAACRRVEECCEQCQAVEYMKYFPAVTDEDGAVTEPEACELTTEKRCHLPGERMVHCRKDPTNPGKVQLFDHSLARCGEAPTDDTPDYCWSTTPPKQVADQWDTDFALCCPPTMENEDPAKRNGDPRYGGTECRNYIFNFDQSSGSYCYHDGEVLPEKNQNRCDEPFEAHVIVDTEWKLFTVPWHELRRMTPNKPPLDPDGIWQLAFYFSSGYLDTYVDDVGFYRKRK